LSKTQDTIINSDGSPERTRAALAETRLRLFEAQTQLNAAAFDEFAPFLRWLTAFRLRHPTVVQLAIRLVKSIYWTMTGNLGRMLSADRRRRAAVEAPQMFAEQMTGLTPLQEPAAPAVGAGVVLMIEQTICKPDQDAGSRCTLSIIHALRELGWRVWYWNHDRSFGGRYSTALEEMGVAAVDGRWEGSIDEWMKMHGHSLDHVMVFRPGVARAVLPAVLRNASCRISYHGHDLHFARVKLQGEQLDDPMLMLKAEGLLALERSLWALFDDVVYLSEDEAEMVAAIDPLLTPKVITPYSFDSFVTRPTPPSSPRLLFVGGFRHLPNGDGLIWFVSEILPLIVEAVPDVMLSVIGSEPTAAVLALAGPRVEVLGLVDDATLARAYDSARVVVAPLRFGAGVKGKVVEALALAVPVVTTSIGIQGIPGLAALVPGHDAPEQFASAVIRFLADDDAWCRQSDAQSAYAQEHFSRAAVRRTVEALL